MSWLSSLFKGARVLDVLAKIKAEAPEAVPLLEALEANDYERAADVVMSYGDAQELQNLLAAQIDGLVDTIAAAAPEAARSLVAELLREHLTADLQTNLVKTILTAGLEQADRIIPEESLLKALALAGIA